METTSTITTVATDATRSLAVRTQTVAHDLVERLQARLADEEGQTAAEYMGILMIIGIIIGALVQFKVGDKIVHGVGGALSDISSDAK
ncbi:MAG TPA: hypothetical protein VF533_09270 [Solirubrobacteraceae bacterium]|jgi:Flp pilus assembly pilin Flp